VLIELSPQGLMLNGLKEGCSALKTTLKFIENLPNFNEAAEIMLRLTREIDKIPDNFPLWTNTRKFITLQECSMRYYHQKKNRRVVNYLFNDLLFIYSTHKKLGIKRKEKVEIIVFII